MLPMLTDPSWGSLATNISSILPPASLNGQQQPDGTVTLSPLDVALSAVILICNALVSVRLNLGLHTQLAVAAVRCVVQLSLLGYILGPIFREISPWPAMAYAMFMLAVATMEATARPHYKFEGMLSDVFASLTTTMAFGITYTMLVVLRVHPWWQPQYLIPILGMIMGNTISGISVGLSTTLEELTSGRDRIEKLLALGASRWEATSSIVGRSVRVALMPLINTMSVTGVVSIPGMMTGQILGGSDPVQASRYQIMIMFVIGGTSAVAAVIAIHLAVRRLLDSHHRLLSDKLQPNSSDPGVSIFLQLPFVLMFVVYGVCMGTGSSSSSGNQP